MRAQRDSMELAHACFVRAGTPDLKCEHAEPDAGAKFGSTAPSWPGSKQAHKFHWAAPGSAAGFRQIKCHVPIPCDCPLPLCSATHATVVQATGEQQCVLDWPFAGLMLAHAEFFQEASWLMLPQILIPLQMPCSHCPSSVKHPDLKNLDQGLKIVLRSVKMHVFVSHWENAWHAAACYLRMARK